MKAQLVAIEKYFTDTGGAKDDATRESFLKEVEATQLTIDGLESESDELTAALADAHEVAGVGGPQEVAERSDKQRYRELVSREHALLAPARARLSGSQRTEAAEVDALFQRCAGVDGTLDAFNARIDQGVEAKLADVRKAIGEEKAYAVEYKDETAMQEAEADTVAGAITHRGLQNVAERFHDIAVRADVGIIDVAWALKDSKTKEVTRLVRQRKMDIKLLDDEFKQVLAEGE